MIKNFQDYISEETSEAEPKGSKKNPYSKEEAELAHNVLKTTHYSHVVTNPVKNAPHLKKHSYRHTESADMHHFYSK